VRALEAVGTTVSNRLSRFAAVLANTRHWAGWKVRRVFGFKNWRT